MRGVAAFFLPLLVDAPAAIAVAAASLAPMETAILAARAVAVHTAQVPRDLAAQWLQAALCACDKEHSQNTLFHGHALALVAHSTLLWCSANDTSLAAAREQGLLEGDGALALIARTLGVVQISAAPTAAGRDGKAAERAEAEAALSELLSKLPATGGVLCGYAGVSSAVLQAARDVGSDAALAVVVGLHAAQCLRGRSYARPREVRGLVDAAASAVSGSTAVTSTTLFLRLAL